MADGQAQPATRRPAWLHWRRLIAATSLGGREPSARRWTLLAIRRQVVAALLPVALLLCAAPAAHAVSSFYWYGENSSNCWQTGQLGSPSFGCDGVGPNYLNAAGSNEGGRAHLYYGGVQVGVNIPASGDYCDDWDTGAPLSYITSQDSTNEVSFTGLETVQPFGSYQETDGKGNTCQAEYQYWGQKLSSKAAGDCGPSCGMHHFVSLDEQNPGGQGDKDRPWAGYFGSPSLVIASDVDANVIEYGGHEPIVWGYVCPVLEDTTTGFMLEYCLQEWRGPFNTKFDKTEWETEHIVSSLCSHGISGSQHGGALDMLKTFFWPGTRFATEYTGSQNTYELPASPGYRHLAAYISTSDLQAAAEEDNRVCAPGHREGHLISTNAADYALIGVEQGIEGWNHFYRAGANTANLQLWTQYNPLPPTASTSAASNVQQFQATLNGSVNPEGSDAKYHFEYGTEAGRYTSSTKPEGDAGSGTNTVSVSPVTITELQANSTYHYRIVATNVTGTATYGADHEFTTVLTSTPVPVLYPTSGNQYVYYRGTNGQLYFWLWNASKESWTLNWEESSHAMAGDPSAVLYPNGNQYVYYRGTDGKLYFWLWNASKESWTLNWEESSHAMAGDPSAVLYPNGNQYVYYRGTDGKLYFWLWNASKESWTLNWEESSHAMAGDPSAVLYPNGNQYVYYRGTDGKLYFWLWNASKESWTLNWEESSHAMAGDPSAVLYPSGNQYVYYRGTDGKLYFWLWNAGTSSWGLNWLESGHPMAGEPSAVLYPTSGNQYVYYRGTDGRFYFWLWNATTSSWSLNWLGSTGAMGGEPAPVVYPNGNQYVYYGGANGQLYFWLWNNVTWGLNWLGSTGAL